MNEFEHDDFEDMYELTAAEGQRNKRRLLSGLLYLVLLAVVVVTGAHAVMLVLSQTATYAFAGQDGLIAALLTGIRVAFPLVVEAAAVVAGLGFIEARWRGPQKTVGFGIEVVWLIFAALNMITFFAVERGQTLQGWQSFWVQYGLPLSALIAGSLTYALLRVDPAHMRKQERSATAERVDAMRFRYFQRARLSPAMLNIERQRAYMAVIADLRREGYTDAQIRFMMSHTPELMFDGDENGRPDVIEAMDTDDQPAAPPQAAQPAAVAVSGNGRGPDFH